MKRKRDIGRRWIISVLEESPLPEKFYRNNDRLLEGGVWAEVTVCHNDIDEDDYAFYIRKAASDSIITV